MDEVSRAASPPHKGAGDRASARAPAGILLAANLRIEGRLLEVHGSGRIVAEILGERRSAVVRNDVPSARGDASLRLDAGQAAVFRVLAVKPQLVLAVLEPMLSDSKSGDVPVSGDSAARGGPPAQASVPDTEGTASPGRWIRGKLVALQETPEPSSSSSPGGHRGLLQWNGRLVSVWTDGVVDVGVLRPFRVLRTIPGILLSGEKIGSEGWDSRAPGERMELPKGSLVFARVLEVRAMPPGGAADSEMRRAWLEIGGLRVEAQVKEGVEPGQTGLFRVERAGAAPVLALVSEETDGVHRHGSEHRLSWNLSPPVSGSLFRGVLEALHGLEATLKEGSPLRQRVEEMIGRLPDLIHKETDVGRPDFLRRFIQHSGIPSETLFRSVAEWGQEPRSSPPHGLVSALLLLETELEHEVRPDGKSSGAAPQTPMLSASLEAIQNVLRHLLLQWTTNAFRFPQEHQLVYDLPFAWAGGTEGGRLLLRFEYEDRSEDRDGKGALSDVLVVFLLDLERMGPVRVDARLKQLERIAVTVMVERPDVESYVRDRLPLLQAGLERCGLRIERLMCIRVRREGMSRDPVFQNDLIQEDGRIHVVA